MTIPVRIVGDQMLLSNLAFAQTVHRTALATVLVRVDLLGLMPPIHLHHGMTVLLNLLVVPNANALVMTVDGTRWIMTNTQVPNARVHHSVSGKPHNLLRPVKAEAVYAVTGVLPKISGRIPK